MIFQGYEMFVVNVRFGVTLSESKSNCVFSDSQFDPDVQQHKYEKIWGQDSTSPSASKECETFIFSCFFFLIFIFKCEGLDEVPLFFHTRRMSQNYFKSCEI